MNIEISCLRDQPEFELTKIIEFSAKIFTPNYFESLEIQKVTIGGEPSTKPSNFIIAEFGGKLVGLVRIVERELLIDGEYFSAAGISSVSVHPEFRGKRISVPLMERALKEIEERQFDFVYLHGRRAVDGFYTQFGFTGIGRYNEFRALNLQAQNNDVNTKLMIAEDISECQQLYNATYHPLSGSMARSEAVWRFLLNRVAVTREFDAFMLEYKNSTVGYAFTSGGRIYELSMDGEYLHILPKVLSALGASTLELHPLHPALALLRRSTSYVYQERLTYEGGYMIKIVNIAKCLQKFDNLVQSRAATLGFLGSIDLLGQKLNDVPQSGHSNLAITLHQNELLPHLITGRLAGQDLISNSNSFPQALLSALFPPSGFHTSKIDEI
ncbi:MAG: putative N-acetyltransferase YhbS [Lentimonas sp.]|jgi:predicted N-acetyltransferase YhbS